MNKSLLEVSKISKIYKMDGVEFKALSNISFSIKKGEYVAIMGPSGCGKSTLMHLIGFLDKPSEGKIYLDGKDISKASEREQAKIRNINIGFVFQQFNLLRRTPAIANVELPLIYAKVNRRERREKSLAELTSVGLKDKINNFPSQLSGGQQQRVAIARALVTNPTIILADEPTGNLDSKSGKEVLELFKKLSSEGHTIILVTHDENVAKNANRIIRLIDGQIVSDDKV